MDSFLVHTCSLNVHGFTCTHSHTHISTHTHTHTHISTHSHTHTHIYPHTNTHISTHMHTHTHISTHTLTHIYPHTRTHVQSDNSDKKDKPTNDRSLGTVPEGPDDYQEVTEGKLTLHADHHTHTSN